MTVVATHCLSAHREFVEENEGSGRKPFLQQKNIEPYRHATSMPQCYLLAPHMKVML